VISCRAVASTRMGQPFGRISREPEPAGIAGFHLFGSVPEPLTLYRDVRALPAGFTRALVEPHPSAPEVEMDPRVIAASWADRARHIA
jgi:hypothetical protein